MRRAALGMLWIAEVACQPHSATPVLGNRTTTSAPAGPSVITSICTDSEGGATADWPAIQHPGAQFVLVDAQGYVATVRIGTHEIDCDDCSGQSVAAFIVGRGELRDPKCYTGVGPVDTPLVHARVVMQTTDGSAELDGPSNWSVVKQLDLDGDFRVDLSLMSRCAGAVPSGCNNHACNKTCTGVLRAGEPMSKVDGITCVGIVPDVDDCHP